MTSGIGNPDWQRRYTVSAVPLLSLTYSDTTNANSPLVDSNGFQSLLVTTDAGLSSVYSRMQVLWYQDANATQFLGVTDWVNGPGAFITLKVPLATRYFKLAIGPVGGVTGGTIKAVVYGTNSDQENLLTQNTAIPLLWANPTIAAGATDTQTLGGMFGGTAMVMVDDGGNNLWTATLQYYDWSTQSFKSFWRARGAATGQTITQMVNLPYAPVRLQVTNNDTAAHTFIESLVAP